MSQGGIWAVFCYVLIKEVFPLFRPKTDTSSQTKDCAAAHGVLAEKINGANEARRDEARLIREAIIDSNEARKEDSKLFREAIGGLTDEIHAWRLDISAALKKGRD